MLRRHSFPLCCHQALGAACLPALRPLCPDGGLWPPSQVPSPPVAVPGEAFGLARRTLALSFRAPAASVQRAWSPGPPAQSVQKRRTAPPLPVPALPEPRPMAAQKRSFRCRPQGARRCTRRRLSHLSKQPASRKLSHETGIYARILRKGSHPNFIVKTFRHDRNDRSQGDTHKGLSRTLD